MSVTKKLNKSHGDRLTEIEKQMLFLMEVPNNVQILESRLDEIASKADKIDAVVGRLDGMLVRELMMRVETLENKVTQLCGFERGNSPFGSIAHIEERVENLDSAHKMIVQMVSKLSEDVRADIDVVREEVADLRVGVNLTMRVVENQAPAGGVVQIIKVKVPEPQPFCGARDVESLENFIFDMEQYFKVTSSTSEDLKVTLATMYLADDAKLWWRLRYMDIQEGRCTIDTWESLKQELRSRFLPENVEILARLKLHELKHSCKFSIS